MNYVLSLEMNKGLWDIIIIRCRDWMLTDSREDSQMNQNMKVCYEMRVCGMILYLFLELIGKDDDSLYDWYQQWGEGEGVARKSSYRSMYEDVPTFSTYFGI